MCTPGGRPLLDTASFPAWKVFAFGRRVGFLACETWCQKYILESEALQGEVNWRTKATKGKGHAEREEDDGVALK